MAAFISTVLLGIVSLVVVVLSRHRVDRNGGIFALAAKGGIGTVVKEARRGVDRFHHHHSELFDGVWTAHTLVVVLATILLFSLENQSFALALGVYRALSENVTPQQYPAIGPTIMQETPSASEEAALYVNAKQFTRILKRRVARQALEERLQWKPKRRKPYMHESRHNHAKRRPRGPNGRFLTAQELSEHKAGAAELSNHMNKEAVADPDQKGKGADRGPQYHQREGVQVSMSQREPTSRPASRHSSQSPYKEVSPSPSSQGNLTHQNDSKAWPPHGLGGTPVTEDVGRGRQQLGFRMLGARSILNSPGQHRDLIESSSSSSSLKRHLADEGSLQQQAMGTGRYGRDDLPPRPLGHQSQGAATSKPGNPHTSSTDQGSPLAANHPYPFSAARRMLTPKSPRAASLSRDAMRTLEPQHLASLPPHAPRSAGPAHDGSPLGGPPGLAGPPHFHGPGQGPGTTTSQPARPTSALSRSLSHPAMGLSLPPSSAQEPIPGASHGREIGGRTAYASGSPFATPNLSNRGPPGSGIMGEGRWEPGILGSLQPSVSGSKNLQTSEGYQQLLTITPEHGEAIYVPVDVDQASKQAYKKRKRDAGMSANYRQRKKEKEKEQQQGLHRLETQNRDLEKRVGELEQRIQELERACGLY
ncbi:hypothetical protein B0H63DRAFT_558048 [Podospora didyma]|uniref:Transcriptional activator HAP2 n=1 Tax=Podospora didyma TaxID=330526 RepID=A0AAE0P0N6_9PEZI|nr:hypothetical protein B0H63DRAFT_558048 [Podospora didyma]